MPVYTYECKRCERREDRVYRMTDNRPHALKCACQGTMTRIFMPPRINTFTEYVTPHINGKPMRISSARQEDAVCKQFGVARLLDSEPDPMLPSKEKRMKAAMKSLPEFHEDYQRTENDLRYGNIPIPVATTPEVGADAVLD